LYLISPAPGILEVIIRKNAEPGRNYSTISDGKNEVEYSNVTKTESRMGCGLGRGGHRPGDIPASSPGGIRDKEEFYRAKK
jgi:hypothetical protein